MDEVKENKEDLLLIIKKLEAKLANIEKTTKKKKSSSKPKIKKKVETEVKIKEYKNKQAKFVKNIFNDDLTECLGDRKFNQKYGKNYQVSPRMREVAIEREIKCTKCNVVYKTFSDETYYICPKCVKI